MTRSRASCGARTGNELPQSAAGRSRRPPAISRPTQKGVEEAVDFYLAEALAALPYPKAELFAAAQETLAASNAAVKSVDVKTMIDESFVKSAADRGVDKR